MNNILRKLKKDNEEVIKKYMNSEKNVKYYPQMFNMKSIIKKNLEDESPFEDEKMNNADKKKPTYNQGGIKKNRIKCYQEMNHELLKEEERKKQKELEEKKKKRKQKVDPKKLEQFFKRNEQELLDNILKLNEKLLTPINENENEDYELLKEEELKNKNQNNNLPINIKQLYLFGTNFSAEQNNNNNNFFIYHKKDRWISFPHSDCVIIDNYIDDISSPIELQKRQTILAKHKNKSYINSLKQSPNGSTIYFKNDDKYIIFYKYECQKKKFDYISEIYINYNELINEYIIDQNDIFCIVVYDNCNVLILDYYSKSEIINEKIDFLEKNKFCGMAINNFTEYKIEFCFYTNDTYKLYDLQYINEIKIIEKQDSLYFPQKKITHIDFPPPIGYSATLCLLIAFEDKWLYLINCDLNEIIRKYNFEFIVNKIIATPFFINLISDNNIIFYKIPNTKNIFVDDIKLGKFNLFEEKQRKEISHESKILCTDTDLYDPLGSSLICTERGLLYYDFFPERKKIKLYGFISEEKYINNCIVINNYNLKEIKKVSHYIVTSHNKGTIKVCGIPSFDIIYEFREKNDEISYLTAIPGQSLFLAFYTSGKVKCFDIHKCKFTGIINTLDIIGKEESTKSKYKNNFIKYAKFYPGGRFCLISDAEHNNLYLFTIDETDPLFIRSRQIPYIQINGLNKIIINKIEPFHTFVITNDYNEIFVYDRKYASLIKTFNLENDTPVYQKKDYLNLNDLNLAEYKFEENSVNYLQNIDKINQNECYYGLKNTKRERERHYLYIFNYRYNALFVRDTKARNTVDAIQINKPVFSLIFENELQNYIIMMNTKEIQKINIDDLTFNKIKYKGIDWIPTLKNYNNIKAHKLILSEDEKIIVLINNNCYNIYLITE